VSRDTVLGQVVLQKDGYQPVECSVRFANNQMDKVNLPVPGTDGPDSYDDSILLFERAGSTDEGLHISSHWVPRPICRNGKKRPHQNKSASCRAVGGMVCCSKENFAPLTLDCGWLHWQHSSPHRRSKETKRFGLDYCPYNRLISVADITRENTEWFKSKKAVPKSRTSHVRFGSKADMTL
jgi:hypothetical protein